jgi:hypothetical protein
MHWRHYLTHQWHPEDLQAIYLSWNYKIRLFCWKKVVKWSKYAKLNCCLHILSNSSGLHKIKQTRIIEVILVHSTFRSPEENTIYFQNVGALSKFLISWHFNFIEVYSSLEDLVYCLIGKLIFLPGSTWSDPVSIWDRRQRRVQQLVLNKTWGFRLKFFVQWFCFTLL